MLDSSPHPRGCFRPLNPKLEVGLDIVWEKSRIFSEAAEKFLERLREKLAPQEL